jgi:hypothetical protein
LIAARLTKEFRQHIHGESDLDRQLVYPKLGNSCLEPSRSSTAPDCQSTSAPAATVKAKLSSEGSKAFNETATAARTEEGPLAAKKRINEL